MARAKDGHYSPDSDNQGGASVSCWCGKCSFFLFTLPNQWKRLSQEYVFHNQGAAATEFIKHGVTVKDENPLFGANELADCKVAYVQCSNCATKLGLICVQGTRDRRYKDIIMLKMRKIQLRKSINSPRIEFDIVERIWHSFSDQDRVEDQIEMTGPSGQQAGQQAQHGDGVDDTNEGDDTFYSMNAATQDVAPVPNTPTAIPIREQHPPEELNTKAQQNNTSKNPACIPCYNRHRKCDRSYPSCRNCDVFGFMCKWPKHFIPPTEAPQPAAAGGGHEGGGGTAPNAGGTIVVETPASTSDSTIPESEPEAEPEAELASKVEPEFLSPTSADHPEVITNVSSVDCTVCRMRHKACDRALPVCGFCKGRKGKRPCAYKIGQTNTANAIDALDQSQHRAVSFNTNTSMQLYDEDEVDDDDDDDNIQPILPRSDRPRPQSGSSDQKHISELRRMLSDQKSIIDQQGRMLSEQQELVRSISTQMVHLHDDTQTKLATMSAKNRRMEKVLQELTRNGILEAKSVQAAIDTSGDWTKSIGSDPAVTGTRRPAPAKRGGLAINYGKRPTENGAGKRVFSDRDSTGSNEPPIARKKVEQKIPDASGQLNDGRHSLGSINFKDSTEPDSTEHNSLYDATPPPGVKATPDLQAMDVDVPSTARGGTAKGQTIVVGSIASKSGRSTPMTLAQRQMRKNSQEITENETQEYLQRFVVDDDPEDEDFSPGDDSQPIFNPVASNPGQQQMESTFQTYRLPLATTRKRRSTGRPRGRPPNKLRSSLLAVQDHSTLAHSQTSVVPSTPPAAPVFASSRGGHKRRGISGATRPVASEFSHGAFSSSQAATMINDPTPQQMKLIGAAPAVPEAGNGGGGGGGGGTSDSFSSAVSPSISVTGSGFTTTKASRRYPQGRIRDAEGFLLNADGTRDKRSMRGRLLGKNAFQGSNGERITAESAIKNSPYHAGIDIYSIRSGSGGGGGQENNGYGADGSFSNSTKPLMLTNSPHRSNALASRAGGMGAASKPVFNTPMAQRTPSTALQAMPQSSPANIGKLAARALEDRVATALARGSGKQYSQSHHDLMAKMGL